MKKLFFTPGPSQLYPTVEKHIKKALEENIASISHRGEKFHGIYKNTQDALRKLLKIPKNYRIFFLSSGTEAMERIIQNTVVESSLHFVNGEFSRRLWQTAVSLGKIAAKIETAPGGGFNFEETEVASNIETICFTHNETSTGVAIPLEYICEIKKKNRDKLVVLDTVSSAPFADVNYKYIDLCFFSVQKGFGLPAGLGVLVVSPAALKTSEILTRKNYQVGTYHSFEEVARYDQKYETPETPNVLAIYLLGKVTEDLLKVGIGKVRREIKKKADLLYDFCKNHSGFQPFVKDKSYRSDTVVVIETGTDPLKIIDKLKKKGLVVGSGYKDFKNKHLRIANFPAHSVSDIKRLIREIKKI